MANVMKVAFKEMTDAEFLAINLKEKGSASRGGGQSYIDFQASEIAEAQWDAFFKGAGTVRVSPKGWLFDVRSLGSSQPLQKEIELSYRDAPRFTRFGLRAQKHPKISGKGRRLYAWRPEETGFPDLPAGVTTTDQLPSGLIADLRLFLIRDDQGHIWAGWRKGAPPLHMPPIFDQMYSKRAGMIELSGAYELDESHPHWPFALVTSSEGPSWDDEDELDAPEKNITYSVQKIRKRDKAAADSVRRLYTACQISGDKFAFLTRSGKPYLEVHHLVPLGKGGANSAHNMIMVSAHMHKMLHHADVSSIDLTKIKNNQLAIMINGQSRTITWHPQHTAAVLKFAVG